MANFRTLDDLGDVTGKVALVRVDLNLPMKEGRASDLTRVQAVAPTILELAGAGALAGDGQFVGGGGGDLVVQPDGEEDVGQVVEPVGPGTADRELHIDLGGNANGDAHD